MDQIARYQSILEDQYYNPNNIDNYKLGINKLNDEDLKVVMHKSIFPDITKKSILKKNPNFNFIKKLFLLLFEP
jgi:hypothetical protein